LKEIYGMSDSNFIKFSKLIIVQSGFSPSKINLNKATYQEMRRHPYINHLFAKSVLAYVKMHGSINSLEELVRIGSLTEEEIVKVRPYLDVGL
jgi:DNA uptake protein ComE-like DNA-binding protein